MHISGLGVVPGRGSFTYLTSAPRLDVHDVLSGRLITSVPLVETVIVAAKPPLNEVPSETLFPLAFRSFEWTSSEPLQARADEILGKYFRYLPREQSNTVNIATTYTPVPLPGDTAA